VQYSVGPMFVPTMPWGIVRHPARTASHINAKKATVTLLLLKMARTRKKKRSAVLEIAKGYNQLAIFPLLHSIRGVPLEFGYSIEFMWCH